MIAFVLALLVSNGPAVEGPISDLVDARLEAIASRIDERFDTQSRVIRSRLDILTERLESFRDERRSILSLLSEARRDRGQLRERLEELRKRADRWTPLQNLADRLLALGWKLIGVVVLFFVLIELARALTLWTLNRVVGSFRDILANYLGPSQ